MKQQHRKKYQLSFRFQSKCLDLQFRFKRILKPNYTLRKILLSLWLFLVE